ncbi:NADH-quinone oxidoreductase subunit NuoE [Ruegeria meonggei]|uniref:NADH-quinone oxidoreductase chain 2 n=1 Tax=Ruegeria meonggei TaxID=1446476 RepID=A0A1X6YEM1_9RHOB|nr:NADH-quinone oxidoreductase subunit NuoE [Ruegeria meonggei]SLN18211.1 NADH-quinone oxidoreductase chain 2 [Ruegeria meonggei]
MLRRLHPEQPESFAFTAANQQWAEAQVTKFPEGRQASAVIPLLWRAQEQEGWLSRPAIESVADMLGMAYIRVLEVASFYFMFQLQPVGSVAHIQVCGTTSCMICGAEDLIAVCKDKIAAKPHALSADGKLSWEEVECLGSCTNAPMVQIGKDYYEDLTAENFGRIIDDLVAGKVPTPGPQNGRYAAEPLKGLSSLTEYEADKPQYNASVALAADLGDTVKRIEGTEVPILTPWLGKDGKAAATKAAPTPPKAPAPAKPAVKQAEEAKAAKEAQPETLTGARDGKADDLKMLKGVGPKLEQTLNELGFYHFDQIAAWTSEQVAWVDARLKFKGRIERDGWIEQAAKLAAGEETEFAKRVKKDGTYED